MVSLTEATDVMEEELCCRLNELPRLVKDRQRDALVPVKIFLIRGMSSLSLLTCVIATCKTAETFISPEMKVVLIIWISYSHAIVHWAPSLLSLMV